MKTIAKPAAQALRTKGALAKTSTGAKRVRKAPKEVVMAKGGNRQQDKGSETQKRTGSSNLSKYFQSYKGGLTDYHLPMFRAMFFAMGWEQQASMKVLYPGCHRHLTGQAHHCSLTLLGKIQADAQPRPYLQGLRSSCVRLTQQCDPPASLAFDNVIYVDMDKKVAPLYSDPKALSWVNEHKCYPGEPVYKFYCQNFESKLMRGHKEASFDLMISACAGIVSIPCARLSLVLSLQDEPTSRL